MKIMKLTLVAALIAVVATLVPGRAQEDRERPAPAPVIDAKARLHLEDAFTYLGTAQEFIFKATITEETVRPGGRKLQFESELKVAVRRPNGIRTHRTGDFSERRFFFDGEMATILDDRNDLYARIPATGSIDEALPRIFEKAGFVPPLSDLLYTKPHNLLTAEITGAEYLGIHRVSGRRCHHIVVTTTKAQGQIWIDAGPRPLFRKIVITYTRIPSAPQYEAVFTHWDFAPRLVESSFRFDPPDQAHEVGFEASQ